MGGGNEVTTLDYQYEEWCIEWLAWRDQTGAARYFAIQQSAMENFWHGPEHDDTLA
jgi:hypothetical protein